jgi:hypothetical protein
MVVQSVRTRHSKTVVGLNGAGCIGSGLIERLRADTHKVFFFWKQSICFYNSARKTTYRTFNNLFRDINAIGFKRKPLWNQSRKDYHNREVFWNLWSEVAEELK